jgi:hypothetical protein
MAAREHEYRKSHVPHHGKKKNYPHNRPWRSKVFEMLRIPHGPDNRLTDGGEIASLTLQPRSACTETFFLYLWY